MEERHNVAVVYASVHHGNTKKIAEIIGEVFSAQVLSVEEAKAIDASEFELIGFGSGIYFGRYHRSLLQLVDSWPTRPCQAFIFSTAGLPFLRWFQHRALRKRLVQRGFRVVGEFCCRGWDTVGPLWLLGGINRKHPNTGDMNRAMEFAGKTKASL